MLYNEKIDFCINLKNKYKEYFQFKKVLVIESGDEDGYNHLFEQSNYLSITDETKFEGPINFYDTIIVTKDNFCLHETISYLNDGGLFVLFANKDIDLKTLKYFFPDIKIEMFDNDYRCLYGIKKGEKYLIQDIVPLYEKSKWSEHIFVIDSWPDNESKENDLLKLIKKLKYYNIDILLVGHYPMKPEIQKMVDYYIYDKNNPLLLRNEFEAYGVTSGRWAQFYNCKIDNLHEFHHDYAIWETMRSAFNYCKFLNKKYIHFFEYDNNPDLLQYRQSFLERIHEHDAIIYEYHPNSIDDTLLPFCATYIFSIKTDIAIDVINLVKSKKEYFSDRPNGWQLERIFLYYLKQKTNNILKTSYVANNNELNTQAVWNRDGVDRNGAKFQAYLAVDKDKLLYIHLVSGFHGRRTDCDYLIEINYEDYHRFYYLKKDDMMVEPIGVYNKGSRVKIYHEGVEVFNEYLGKEYEEFYKLNNIIFNSTKKPNPKSINLNFVDGAYVHIDDDNDVDYKIDFIDKKSQKLIYSTNVKGTWWSRTSKIYYTDWLIKITGNEFKYAYNLDLKDKRVLISFESKSLGDNLAWIPYVEKFREKHNCKIICSTFHNKMFKDQYQEIEFVEPGTVVNDLHAQYRIGLFKKDGKVDYDRHPENPLKVPLTKIASDILGLDYEELKPRIKNYAEYKRKTVTIAVHSTAQCKYWNNPNGWQDIVDYLKANGYEVILLSREEDGYMGNKNPSGVIQHPPGDIEKVIKVIQESTFFIGLSSGLSWLAWACNIPTVLISGFTDDDLEPQNGIIRVINKNVCNGCWSRHDFDAGDWNWCPDHKGTSRQFECSKEITSEMVIEKIKGII